MGDAEVCTSYDEMCKSISFYVESVHEVSGLAKKQMSVSEERF